jgi:predicted enzyme related to lactoylglutathione lyase
VTITVVFAGIAVADHDSAWAWYERLFGRPPDMVPNEREVVWQLAETGLIYVVADAERASGTALLTLIVDEMDDHLADLAERGLGADSMETLPGVGRKAIFTDPEGNMITFAELLGT